MVGYVQIFSLFEGFVVLLFVVVIFIKVEDLRMDVVVVVIGMKGFIEFIVKIVEVDGA